MIRKFEAKDFIRDGYGYIWITLHRTLDKTIVDKSLEKRNTGFQLTWFFEDSSGKRVDIEQDKKIPDLNDYYIAFLNLLFDAFTNGRVRNERNGAFHLKRMEVVPTPLSPLPMFSIQIFPCGGTCAPPPYGRDGVDLMDLHLIHDKI